MAKKLSTYHAKRDFSKTAEPKGAERTVASKTARFVIQKHAATRLHYDFRLELDGVFKSWAVTRGPSLDPKDKRLAVEVEDHPLDYGDFEGTIPAGEYGGGTVQIWDRGYWLSENPQKELQKGDLKFALAGEKLRGSWALVRMKSDRNEGKRTNWLLIKHRDEFAVDGDGDAVLEDDRSVASGRKMEAITAGRGKPPAPFMTKKGPTADAIWHSKDGGSQDDDAAPSRKTAARAAPPGRRTAKSKAAAPEPRKLSKIAKATKAGKAVMPDMMEPQLCKSVERPPTGAGWGHEIKLDGYRIIIRVENGHVKLLTRKGLDWAERFPQIAEAMSKLPDCMIDGEIAALDSKGRTDFPALQAALSEQKTENLIFFSFDLLFEAGEDLRKLPLVERKQRLERLIGDHDTGTLRYVEHLTSAGDEVLRSACKLDLEGIVSKRLDATYHSGRSEGWRKSKCRNGHEVVLGGWTSNNGTDFRSLLAGVFRDGKLAYVGRIGTGYGQAKARQLLPKLKKAASKKNPFTGTNAPKGGANIHWLRPELVAEIEFAGWTSDGQIRQAAFKGLREDKPAREIEAEVPAPAEDMPMVVPKPESKPMTAKRSTSRRRQAAADDGDTTVMGVEISKPDKVLWPADGDSAAVTKLDLARYFEAVGDWVMPHIIGRPCSVVRMPDGIGGESFFQRHATKGMSDLLDVMDVSDERQPYLVVNHREGLAALAQIAALELHPWNCIPGNPDRPGRLVFDIDPGPDVNFDLVVDTAKELKERLAGLGLESFCKTTGGKGLHVVTPLVETAKAATDWATAKDLSHALCLAMEADTPDLYVVNMAKSKREGRIFLDYLRNDRMATAVAPLSPRARPGATVSMPLSWARVRAGLDPHTFTIRTAPSMLKKAKPWSDYDDARRSLADAIKKLKRKR
jgi:bifunctional non-homologous end joining protein LigD